MTLFWLSGPMDCVFTMFTLFYLANRPLCVYYVYSVLPRQSSYRSWRVKLYFDQMKVYVTGPNILQKGIRASVMNSLGGTLLMTEAGK